MMTNRTRLVMLSVCALLSTSAEPFTWMQEDSNPALASVATTNLPAVGAGPIRLDPMRVEASMQDLTSTTTGAADQLIVADVLRRLSNRHTGLQERERLRVARTIVREARRHDLDPDLVIAVIEVESAGYHLAVSHVGAMGLMQLLPSTAEELAGKHGIEWLGDDTLFDPVVNIMLGTAYLRQLTNRFGDVSVALAAYNWGPGRIHRRLRRGATVPSKYIEQVMEAYDRSTRLASRRS